MAAVVSCPPSECLRIAPWSIRAGSSRGERQRFAVRRGLTFDTSLNAADKPEPGVNAIVDHGDTPSEGSRGAIYVYHH
jgi:hypothetical protein